MIAGFQHLEHGRVRLGLGRMVGANDGFQLAPGGRVRRLGEGAPRQSRRDEIHHIGGMDPQAQLAQQVLVAPDQPGIGAQEGLYRLPADLILRRGLGFRLARLLNAHRPTPPKSLDLPLLGVVGRSRTPGSVNARFRRVTVAPLKPSTGRPISAMT